MINNTTSNSSNGSPSSGGVLPIYVQVIKSNKIIFIKYTYIYTLLSVNLFIFICYCCTFGCMWK